MDATGARDLGAVVLGLEGFRLVAVDEHDGELELAVETTADMVGCPRCGAVAWAHGRRPVRVRDLPVGGRPTTLIWIKRLWRCRYPRCETRTWSETSREIPPRASLTTRAARLACQRVGRDGEAVAVVAWDFGVGWGTVMRAVVRARHPAGRRPRPAGRGGRARGRRDRLPGRDRDPSHRVRHRPGRPHPHRAGRPGCSTSCLVAAVRCSRAGCAGRDAGWRRRRGGRGAGPVPRVRHRAAHPPARRGPRARRVPCREARLRRRGPGPPPGAAGHLRAPRPRRRPALRHPPGAAPRA